MGNFYESFLSLCAKEGKTPSGVAAAIGLSNAAASGWKKGKVPSDTTLAKLSEFFGVSVDVLTGKETQKEKPDEAKIVELIPNYMLLSKENKEKAQQFIAFLLTQQQSD